MQPKVVDLNALVTEIEKMLRRLIGEDILFATVLHPRVGNVRESYATDHPSVTPGPYVLLAVTDTGVGMDEETRARIFEPFSRRKCAAQVPAPGPARALHVRVHGRRRRPTRMLEPLHCFAKCERSLISGWPPNNARKNR